MKKLSTIFLSLFLFTSPTFAGLIHVISEIDDVSEFHDMVKNKSGSSSTSSSDNINSLISILKKLDGEGYKSISKIEFDDGSYEIEAVNSEGKEKKLNVSTAIKETTE